MKNNKALGQHWLKNRQILDQIATLATISANNLPTPPRCLEIGPGLGTLTSALLRKFPEVIAVEYDDRLAHNLPQSFPGKNLQVIHQDFLQFDLTKISAPYVVAGNIPYYITSPIITKLLTTDNLPTTIVLLIQKEVAMRISATSGKHTVLSLQVQNLASVQLGPVVLRKEFSPPPQVDSQIIVLHPRTTPQIPLEIFALIKQGFSAPRKKLIKNLPIAKEVLLPIFQNLGLSPDVRPADLTLQDWQKLALQVQPIPPIKDTQA